MLREMLKSKIHRAVVTATHLSYEGSLSLPRDLMDAADILPNEKVQVVNCNNGSRMETYVIEGPPDTGEIMLNGAAARLGQPGDVIIIIAYALMDDAEARTRKPAVVKVNAHNKIVRERGKGA
jgi:aspartate 1-decarboxylase